jgi:hypothetical protein
LILRFRMRAATSVRRLVVCFVLGFGFAAPAAAQTFGVRAGASVNPDQFYVGAHLETGELVGIGYSFH